MEILATIVTVMKPSIAAKENEVGKHQMKKMLKKKRF